MKITFISDTENKHMFLSNQIESIKDSEVLVHCGDITSRGTYEEVYVFLDWFSRLDNFKHKIFIAGNHDFLFQDHVAESKELLGMFGNVTYLQDQEMVINGLKFYGSPWQPEFGGWAFNEKRGEKIRKHWEKIPLDTGVLITHGPPKNILDKSSTGAVCGCTDLLDISTNKVKPKIHAFGHIHHSSGMVDYLGIKMVNASSANDLRNIVHMPYTIDLA